MQLPTIFTPLVCWRTAKQGYRTVSAHMGQKYVFALKILKNFVMNYLIVIISKYFFNNEYLCFVSRKISLDVSQSSSLGDVM